MKITRVYFLLSWMIILFSNPVQSKEPGDPGVKAKTLSDLACTTDQVARFDGVEWICDSGLTEIEGQNLDARVSVLEADQTLSDLACTTDQVARFDGIEWICDSGLTEIEGQNLDARVSTLEADQLIQTIVVHPVPGDPVASGQNLLDAMTSIVDASDANRYLIKVEPGVFDLQDEFLNIKAWVSVTGSGPQATIIRAFGQSSVNVGTISMGGLGESGGLSDLKVVSEEAGTGIATAIAVNLRLGRIRNVIAEATGGGVCSGIVATNGGTLDVSDTDIVVNTSGFARAITAVASGGASVQVDARNIRAKIIGGASNSHIAVRIDSAERVSLSGLTIEAGGISEPAEYHGFAISNSDAFLIRNSVVTVASDTFNAIGLNASFNTGIVEASRFEVSGPAITRSVITSNGAVVNIANTFLGAPTLVHAGSDIICAGVYDPDYNFLANTCP